MLKWLLITLHLCHFSSTAAHCVTENRQTNASDHYALLGRFNLSDSSETNWIKKEISKFFVHSEFDGTASSQRSHADLAVYRLKTKVEFTEFIIPICLPEDNDEVQVNTLGDLTGYGLSEFSGSGHELTPRDAQVRSMDSMKCIFKHRTFWTILAEGSFCAWSETAGPCRGEKNLLKIA